MAKAASLPANLAPRLVSRLHAAAYVSVSPTTFDMMVDAGTMPRAKTIYGRRVAWDVRALDAAIDGLPSVGGEHAAVDTWAD